MGGLTYQTFFPAFPTLKFLLFAGDEDEGVGDCEEDCCAEGVGE